IGSFFGSAGTSIEKALQDGYAQILIEFDYLNHNVGVTFPLIEFFVWEEMKFGDKPIEDGYDFLVNVFWTDADRQEEIQRVAVAGTDRAFLFYRAQQRDVTRDHRSQTIFCAGQRV